MPRAGGVKAGPSLMHTRAHHQVLHAGAGAAPQPRGSEAAAALNGRLHLGSGLWAAAGAQAQPLRKGLVARRWVEDGERRTQGSTSAGALTGTDTGAGHGCSAFRVRMVKPPPCRWDPEAQAGAGNEQESRVVLGPRHRGGNGGQGEAKGTVWWTCWGAGIQGHSQASGTFRGKEQSHPNSAGLTV